MKKFYALAAAAAVCLSASAFNFKDASNLKSLEVAPRQFEGIPAIEKTLQGPKRDASRASEFDINAYDNYMYIDYFPNLSTSGWVYGSPIFTCVVPDFTMKADGTVTINEFGYNVFKPEMWYDQYEGTLEMELGQVLYTENNLKFVLAALDGENEIYSGITYLTVTNNAISYDEGDGLGVLVLNAEGKPDGWQFIHLFPKWVKSNAEVAYKWTNDGKTLTDYTQRCYTECDEEDAMVYVSGLTPTGASNIVPFTIEKGEGLAYEKIALFSMIAGQGKKTGDFKLVTFGDDNTYAPYVTSTIGEDLKTMTFDDVWGCYAESGYWMGMCTPATYTFDYELPESFAPAGVESVAVDANAPVEYFNLQGVRVNAPEAGQLLIKRQGAQVSKVIVR